MGYRRVEMVSPRRVYARSVVPQFVEVISKATCIKVGPHACIPFNSVRSMSLSGVAQIMRIFDGAMLKGTRMDTHNDTTTKCGISSGTDSAITVEMTGLFLKFVFEHFKRDRLTNQYFDNKVKSRSTWHGIVHELHSKNLCFNIRTNMNFGRVLHGYILLHMVVILWNAIGNSLYPGVQNLTAAFL